MPTTVYTDITVCLRDFGQRCGPTFERESVKTLTLKYIIYTLFPEEWDHIYLCTFKDDARVVKQVKALQLISRSSMPVLDSVECFRLLMAIMYKHHVHPKTHEVVVRNAPRRHHAHHYHRFCEKLQQTNANVTSHRDTLFLLRLAHPELAEDILFDRKVNQSMGVTHEEVDEHILPTLKSGAREAREEQLTELAHFLKYSEFDEAVVNVNSLQRTGMLPHYRDEDDENYTTRKAVHLERIRSALQQRTELLESADPRKVESLDANVRQSLNWAPTAALETLSKRDLIQCYATLSKICAVLEHVQLEGISKHRHNISQAREKIALRERLIERADQETLYQRGLGEAIEWRPQSLANIKPNELGRLMEKLDTTIKHLENHQLVAPAQ